MNALVVQTLNRSMPGLNLVYSDIDRAAPTARTKQSSDRAVRSLGTEQCPRHGDISPSRAARKGSLRKRGTDKASRLDLQIAPCSKARDEDLQCSREMATCSLKRSSMRHINQGGRSAISARSGIQSAGPLESSPSGETVLRFATAVAPKRSENTSPYVWA